MGVKTQILFCFVYSADGALMFQQVPLVEIDGMKLVQTKAILNYIAEKYGLHGKELQDRVKYEHFRQHSCDVN